VYVWVSKQAHCILRGCASLDSFTLRQWVGGILAASRKILKAKPIYII